MSSARMLNFMPQSLSAPSFPAKAPLASFVQAPLPLPDQKTRDEQLLDGSNEPWLSKEATQARRASLGMSDPYTAAFVDRCEFVGLGNFCAVSRALQCINVKKKAYPFDWVRSPVEGVLQCFENEFEDFLTFTHTRDDEASKMKVYTNTRWGGSFWHHDPMEQKAKADFKRRIERLFGIGDIPASQPRFFVRAANSTAELRSTLLLYEALQRALPQATIYLLIIVDFQMAKGPARIASDAYSRILFYRLHESLFTTQPWSMQRVSEAYAEAVAFAAHFFARGLDAAASVSAVSGIAELESVCDQFHGGNCASDGFWPLRFQGQQICLRRSHPRMPGLLTPAPSSGFLPAAAAPASMDQMAELRIPVGIAAGDIVDVVAFGGKVRLQVPFGAFPGQLMQLRFLQGVVTTVVVAAALTAATTQTAVAGSWQRT